MVQNLPERYFCYMMLKRGEPVWREMIFMSTMA